MRHCRIKNWKETRSFLIRSPFDIYPSQTSKNQVFTIREMILCGGKGYGLDKYFFFIIYNGIWIGKVVKRRGENSG